MWHSLWFIGSGLSAHRACIWKLSLDDDLSYPQNESCNWLNDSCVFIESHVGHEQFSTLGSCKWLITTWSCLVLHILKVGGLRFSYIVRTGTHSQTTRTQKCFVTCINLYQWRPIDVTHINVTRYNLSHIMRLYNQVKGFRTWSQYASSVITLSALKWREESVEKTR